MYSLLSNCFVVCVCVCSSCSSDDYGTILSHLIFFFFLLLLNQVWNKTNSGALNGLSWINQCLVNFIIQVEQNPSSFFPPTSLVPILFCLPIKMDVETMICQCVSQVKFALLGVAVAGRFIHYLSIIMSHFFQLQLFILYFQLTIFTILFPLLLLFSIIDCT